jgi:hypothetical protein
MTKNNFFNGLVGVIIGSATGIAMVLEIKWNSWWQIILAIIIGGFVGLFAADRKWAWEKIKISLTSAKKINPSISYKKIAEGFPLAYFIFTVVILRVLVIGIIGSLFAFISLVLLFHKSCCINNDIFTSFLVVLSGLIVLPFTSLFFGFLFTGNDVLGVIGSKKGGEIFWKAVKRPEEKVSPLRRWCFFEKNMFLSGLFSALKVLVCYLQVIVWTLVNIVFIPVALVYFFYYLWERARHLAIFSSIAVSVIAAFLFDSWLGLFGGIGFFLFSFVLSRDFIDTFIKVSKVPEVYSKSKKVWRWEFAKNI